jgi:hypothetical protein
LNAARMNKTAAAMSRTSTKSSIPHGYPSVVKVKPADVTKITFEAYPVTCVVAHDMM